MGQKSLELIKIIKFWNSGNYTSWTSQLQQETFITPKMCCQLTLVGAMGNGHCNVFAAVVILWFGRRSSEATDAWFRWCAHRSHAVCVIVGACGHLIRGAVRDKALCDLKLGVLQVLLQLSMFVRSGQLLVCGRRTLCGHHTVSSLI